MKTKKVTQKHIKADTINAHITYDELYALDDFIDEVKEDFEKKCSDIMDYIPTVEELEKINIRGHFREYAPFIIYMIKHLDDVREKSDNYSDEDIKNAKEVRAYLCNIQSACTVEAES